MKYVCWHCAQEFNRDSDTWYCPKCVKNNTCTPTGIRFKPILKDQYGNSGVIRESQEKLGPRYRIVQPKNGSVGGVFDMKGGK